MFVVGIGVNTVLRVAVFVRFRPNDPGRYAPPPLSRYVFYGRYVSVFASESPWPETGDETTWSPTIRAWFRTLAPNFASNTGTTITREYRYTIGGGGNGPAKKQRDVRNKYAISALVRSDVNASDMIAIIWRGRLNTGTRYRRPWEKFAANRFCPIFNPTGPRVVVSGSRPGDRIPSRPPVHVPQYRTDGRSPFEIRREMLNSVRKSSRPLVVRIHTYGFHATDRCT